MSSAYFHVVWASADIVKPIPLWTLIVSTYFKLQTSFKLQKEHKTFSYLWCFKLFKIFYGFLIGQI